MVTDLDLQAHFAQFAVVLVLAGAALPLRLIVHVLAVVEQAADGGHRARSDFYQVEVSLAGSIQRLTERQYAQALSILADDEDFPRANALVPANFASYARTLMLNR